MKCKQAFSYAHFLIFVLLAGLWVGCKNKETCYRGAPDRNYDFLDGISRIENGDYLQSLCDFKGYGFYYTNSQEKKPFNWLRKPENMLRFYHSAKAVGLFHFISVEEYQKPLFEDEFFDKDNPWHKQSLEMVLGNLIGCYTDSATENAEPYHPYYTEFWDRRRAENNDEVVFEILYDIFIHYSRVLEKQYAEEYDLSPEVFYERPGPAIGTARQDSILTGLLSHEVMYQQADSTQTKSQGLKYLEYLHSIGLTASAANFAYKLSGRVLSNGLNNEDESMGPLHDFMAKIEVEPVPCLVYEEWRDEAKWIHNYDDNP